MLCERCGGTGVEPEGRWTGKAYDSVGGGPCTGCDGNGNRSGKRLVKGAVVSKSDFMNLGIGDIIKHDSLPDMRFIVTDIFGDRATAVAAADVTNPYEWEVVRKASYKPVFSSEQIEATP